jgi:hypothetical protein
MRQKHEEQKNYGVKSDYQLPQLLLNMDLMYLAR